MNGSLHGGFTSFLGFAVAVVSFLVASVLAVIFAATVVVMGVVATALIGLTALALRARRTVRVRSHANSGVIEARRVGHTWVAYGWNEPRR